MEKKGSFVRDMHIPTDSHYKRKGAVRQAQEIMEEENSQTIGKRQQ